MKKNILVSTNPARNYEIVGSVDISTVAEIKQKVEQAQKAKTFWKELGIKKRVEYVRKVQQSLLARKAEIINLIVRETGKSLKDTESEVERYNVHVNWFLENGEKSLSDEITFEDEKFLHRVKYEPMGVAAVITPWNLPFGMFCWGVVPNLIAGNTVVFKHSEECPLTGKLIEEIVKSVNLPTGVFSEVYGDGQVGKMLLEQNINLIWFTGSSAVGHSIYKVAAEKFIKVVLEMGGSNPGIIFEDVDVDRFIDKIYMKRFLICGQTCDALKRLIVQEAKFSEVVEKLKVKIEEKVVGDPLDPKTDIGSLVAKRQVELLDEQVKDAVKKGAKVIIGGKQQRGLHGAFYEPTILTKVTRNMRVWNEETFGPVLVIVPFATEEEAVALANDTRYGLGSIVFTKDKKRAERVAVRLDAGTVEINMGNHWLTCNPFGGYKDSGMGREHGKWGFQELTQIKVISEEK